MSKSVSIKAKPTFWAPVEIPAPGGSFTVEVEFKHRTRTEFQAWIKEAQERRDRGEAPPADIDQVLDIATGWKGVEEEFTRENVEVFIDNYHGASFAMGQAYGRELAQARLGN